MADSPRRQRPRKKRRKLVTIIVAAAIALQGAAGLWYFLQSRGAPAADTEVPEYVTTAFLPRNSWSRPGTTLRKIRGVVIHYVANPGTSARANRNYFANLSITHEAYASSHFIVGLEGEVLQCVPLTEIAYASNDRNSDTVSIEVCHPDESGEFSPASYERLVELTAWLCREFRLQAEDVIRHYDVTGKLCPKYYVENEEAWLSFRRQVAEKLQPS